MSGEPRGTPPDPAGIGAGGPSPAGGNPQPPAGRQPGQPAGPDWEPLSGWDDDPEATGARNAAGAWDGTPAAGPAGAWDGWPPADPAGMLGADGGWDEQPPAGASGGWDGWPPTGGAWDVVQRRRGRSPLPADEAGGGPRAGAWRGHPAVRVGLLGLAVVLALMAAASAWPRPSRERAAGPSAPARASGAGHARPAYAFAPPAGWRDATQGLAPRFPGTRPDVVLVGPASAGFGANLSVVRTSAGRAQAPLAALPGAALRQLHTTAALVGRSRWLTLAGEPAVAADYLLTKGGGRLHARQVACYHLGDLYLVTLTAEAGAFPSQASAQDRVIRSWRWT
jgi:hypothetical protein